MKFPILSFSLSIFIWLIFLFALNFNYNFFTDKINKTSIEVDASIVDSISKQNKEQEKLPVKTDENSLNQKKETSLAKNSDKAAIVARPLPEIPADLRNEAFKSFAIARFNIKKDGSFTVELIKPCANPRLNQLLLKSLKKWQFSSSNNDHIQDIRVNFKVE